MRRWIGLPLAALLLAGCTGKMPANTGGPLGPSVKNTRPAQSQQAEPGKTGEFQPGEILVQPKPGQTIDDLKRQFGADNVTPYRPEGLSESDIVEFGLDQWFVIKVPEGEEIGAASGLVEKGDIVGQVRLAPKRDTA